MRTIYFNSFNINSKLPLKKIGSFFKMHKVQDWYDYIILDSQNLASILKYRTSSKSVYIFKFGSITFVNFNEYERHIFMEYLESIVGRIDYSLYVKFHEWHVLNINDDNMCYLINGENDNNSILIEYKPFLIPIISIILAKSAALYKIEVDVNKLLDKVDQLILLLQKGKLKTNSKSFSLSLAKLVRFEYESVNGIKLFDRSHYRHESSISRDLYDEFENYYEIHDRFKNIKSKIDNMNGIIKTYSNLSYRNDQERQYKLEIFLLLFFPIIELIRYFFDNATIRHMIYIFLKSLLKFM